MTLPASGLITMNMINVELGRAGTAPINLNEAACRTLAGVPSGIIRMSDFYGKSAQAFPVRQGTIATTASNSTGALACNLPAGIVANERLVLVVSTGSAGTPPTTPAGWTLLANTGTGGNCMTFVFHKVATGSEGASVSVGGMGNAGGRIAFAMRYTGVAALEASIFNDNVAANTTDPPALTPTFGAQKTKWLAIGTQRGSTVATTGFPAGFADTSSTNSPSGASLACYGGVAHLDSQVASVDPGVFTYGGTGNARSAITVALGPT